MYAKSSSTGKDTYRIYPDDYIVQSLIIESAWDELFAGVKRQKDINNPNWEKNLTDKKDEISKRINHITSHREIDSKYNERRYFEYIDHILELIEAFLSNVNEVNKNDSRFIKSIELISIYKHLDNKVI